MARSFCYRSLPSALAVSLLFTACRGLDSAAAAADDQRQEATFEQLVVRIDRGMTIEEVLRLLDHPDSKQPTADGYEEWSWERREIRGIWRGQAASTYMRARVWFWQGSTQSVQLEYRLF